ncbi:MAG: glycosyltransferase, partial [Candidatus Omnitrophica bacterium]|nr:glycosyltransferase [Candidatus Omnitrophota bacterium]
MPKVSLIIPSYNSFRTIPRTLGSVFGLKSFDKIHEIIVADCSDDARTKLILEEYSFLKLSVLNLPKSTPAFSRNAAARAATGDILCFIDSDVFLDETWLEEVLAASAAGCRAGAGSVSIPPFQQDNLVALAQLYLQFNETLALGQRRPIDLVPACNMFVDRELFEKLGGFPLLRASEDVLFCLKCAPYAPVWFVPQARCFHIFREDRRAFFQNQMILGQYIITYRRAFYQKWYYDRPWAALFLPFFVGLKSAWITGRVMKCGPAHMINFIRSLPLFLAGMFFWAKGF